MTVARSLLSDLRRAELTRRMGVVRSVRGLAIESEGPRTHVGELCALLPAGEDPSSAGGRPPPSADTAAQDCPGRRPPLLAEVVAIRGGTVTLMPYGGAHGLTVGASVVALGRDSSVGVGEALLGRVIDGFGHPLDGGPPPAVRVTRPLRGPPQNPLQRPRIERVLETGIRCIDALFSIGVGQRIGIFSGSGVGKTTLLGMITRHAKTDVNVIALVGERGREVREFIERQLGTEGLKRSVVVVATADQPALARIRAAHAAVAIAGYFRERGRHVLLTMDSLTRLAMARREIGLSAGEPPTARGYTPSVFAELAELCERAGTAPSGGSMSALLTVLVEGDDLNEPISDALRAILDGHIALSRQVAHQGLYPAIDVLRSASRLMADLTTPRDRELVAKAVSTISLLERSRQLVELGAYQGGTNPDLDAALACQPRLRAWLAQSSGGVPRDEAMSQLAAALAPPAAPPPVAAHSKLGAEGGPNRATASGSQKLPNASARTAPGAPPVLSARRPPA